MNLVSGTSTEPPGLPARDGPWRLRPGEAPVWVDLELSRASVAAWRDRAAALHLGVDAWLALLVEQTLIAARLSDVGISVAEVSAEAVRSLRLTRLAPTGALRQWGAQLEGRRLRSRSAGDELPSVVLPERLLAQLVPGTAAEVLFATVSNGGEAQALAIERAATAVGQTAEAWAYLAALSLRRAG
jgi:hypothetical protein